MRVILNTDGGARGNPGPAGAGFVVADESGTVISSGGRFLGEATNNVAEYEAFLWGLRAALECDATQVLARSDSELLVRQMNGQYRVKHPNIKPLFAQAQTLIARFDQVEVQHVRREENTAADKLANEAMDARAHVGALPVDDSMLQGTLFE